MADWRRQLKGAFAFDSAPFAVHPNDERRARTAISNAIRSGASKTEIEREIEKYFQDRKSAQEFIKYQIGLFRSYFGSQYSTIRNCWVLSKATLNGAEFIAIFSGRTSIDDILCHCMHIYESREYNQATQLMRAKKKSWPVFRIQFHPFESGALWEGRAFVGESPDYLLERADATLSKGLDPTSSITWRPKPIPKDPGETWHGMRYPS
ncbi:hypothetical protein OOJ09_14105 [Mesorhizobium qingshengii]|uniref:Uncharacterized protein n=1 Tax=Mesorhizobium qingshengii TaxID=1165689 RepID=A0ABT4QUT1_9HYPH|nr:hypothetical protein [Mesorhizobium qingshengii]MCZ8545322.1 hypothetical protein [Mesorhizobium qingshengii]